MFRRKTVFILGAGASWHYSYPTGEELVRRVIEKAEIAGKVFSENQFLPLPKYVENKTSQSMGTSAVSIAYREAVKECQTLSERLRYTNPLVIDYFLGHNPALSEVGRFLIAWVLLECESRFEQHARINQNRSTQELIASKDNHDDWYRFILHKLTSEIVDSSDLLRNEVTFVTFNYDTSLDNYLYRALSMFQNLAPADVDKFLHQPRILHIYGSIRPSPVRSFEPVAFTNVAGPNIAGGTDPRYLSGLTALDAAYNASKTLKVIEPHDKGNNDTITRQAISAIKEAEVVYILGYGFDGNNSARLGLQSSLGNLLVMNKTVLFTNFGDSNRVNLEAAKVFCMPSRELVAGRSLIPGEPSHRIFLEKSIRNVYDAFAFDFDAPEQ